MLDGGFIKLHRKMVKWEWYQDANTFRVFVHLLLTANYEPRRFQGMVIERGQRVTSIAKLSKELKISVKAIRVALNHLQGTDELTCQGTAKYTVITVNNYDFYQKVDSEEHTMITQPFCENAANSAASQKANNYCSKNRLNTGKNQDFDRKGASTTASSAANEGQTKGKLRANEGQQWKKDKESKRKIKKDKEERGAHTRNHFGEFQNVILSDSEVAELKKRYPTYYEAKIERLSRYLASTGKTYRDHFATLLDWLQEDVDQEHEASGASYDINELEKIDTLEFIE